MMIWVPCVPVAGNVQAGRGNDIPASGFDIDAGSDGAGAVPDFHRRAEMNMQPAAAGSRSPAPPRPNDARQAFEDLFKK